MSDESGKQQPSAGRHDTNSTGEFFSVGAPLHAVRVGYVHRKADDLLFDTLASGGYAHVLAPDRSGKTSLIAAVAARLEANGCKVAILDLAQIGERDGGGDPGRWYYNVAYRILRQLRIRYDLQTWWHDKSVLSNRQRLLEFYSEIVLQHVPERIVVFVDEIQCIEDLSFADQLLASIRAAHNARTTDPDFSRLTFVLLGECDPVSLLAEAELSPFNVTQQIVLNDFTRDELEIFATELNLEHDAADVALDRIYYWTRGQPYLSQKLARQVAREEIEGDVADEVNHIALTQLAGRAALHSEPHMSHIHRVIENDRKRKEALLNLYGRIRKGIEVPADLGSALQRRLMAVGLVEIDHDGKLRVRNRLYEAVFTARWANENLPTRLRVPAMAAGLVVLLALVPFWYTQWLPRPYMEVLTSSSVELDTAVSAYENLRSFPGHADTADSLFRNFVEQRALNADTQEAADAIANLSLALPDHGELPDTIRASFWDRQSYAAMRGERRDEALLATLEALVVPTARRRQRAAGLIADDYPRLLASIPSQAGRTTVFDPASMLLTSADGAQLSQWSYATQELQLRESWTVTALEVVPLVRRVIIDRDGSVRRIGLTLNISHARLSDLRIKIIAPSGRAVEIETGLERSSSNDDILIPVQQLRDLVGESLAGTWSISLRDEGLGVAGRLVGWNLKLNSQGAVEDFQRGLNIPDPVERETDDVWFDDSGRYAVARAMQSDSARIWDLAFAEPVRAIAVSENEALIGLDAGARHLVTATQGGINLWDVATGDRVLSLGIGATNSRVTLTDDGAHLFVEHHGDNETRLELWSLDEGSVAAELVVAGVPSLVAIDPTGSRVAVADYDRAVRVWDLVSGELVAQIDLARQASQIDLAAGGEVLGVVYGRSGVSLWSVAQPQRPLMQDAGDGDWQLVFAPSGASVMAGRTETGYQTYSSRDGKLVGPPLGVRAEAAQQALLAYSQDEQFFFTGNPAGVSRIWRVPDIPAGPADESVPNDHMVWRPAADQVTLVLPGMQGIAIGDSAGHVHFLPIGAGLADTEDMQNDVSFIGHNATVVRMRADDSGRFVASVAEDNSLRVWDSGTGAPLPFMPELGADEVSGLSFSPDASLLAVLQASNLTVISVADGLVIAALKLGETHSGLAFANNHQIYVGGESGALRLAVGDPDGSWSIQQLWQGSRPIQRLQASPRGDYLIIVDEAGLASQLALGEGRIGAQTLALPSRVEEISFSRSGTRVLFRTSRWTHRAVISTEGLLWIDSVISPKPLNGGRIVFGPDRSDTAKRAYFPTARNGFVELVELPFPGSSRPGLFGNRYDLLAEWRARLGVSATPQPVDGEPPD